MEALRKKRRRSGKLQVPHFLTGISGLVCAQAIRAWMSTLDYRAAFYYRAVDPARGVDGPRIYIFWHENLLMPLFLRGRCHLTMLLSQHRDADVLAEVANHMGFDCVRGSTYQGGASALWELFRRSRQQHLTITPDGPRGPRRQLAIGPIFLASRLGLPLVPMGFGYDRPWRMNSWDRFAVPRPFSRGRAVIGPPLRLRPNMSRVELGRCRIRVERLLNDLTLEAEAWATAGTCKAGEVVLRPQFAPQPRRSEISSEHARAA